MSFWADYKRDVNWNSKRVGQKNDLVIQDKLSTPIDVSYVKSCWCHVTVPGMIGEVLSGDNEPLEVLYTCSRCGKQVLSVEGIRDEIVKEGVK